MGVIGSSRGFSLNCWGKTSGSDLHDERDLPENQFVFLIWELKLYSGRRYGGKIVEGNSM